MRGYNSCNYGFTVLHLFTVEENKEERDSGMQGASCGRWWADLWLRGLALPVTGSVILSKALASTSPSDDTE